MNEHLEEQKMSLDHEENEKLGIIKRQSGQSLILDFYSDS